MVWKVFRSDLTNCQIISILTTIYLYHQSYLIIAVLDKLRREMFRSEEGTIITAGRIIRKLDEHIVSIELLRGSSDSLVRRFRDCTGALQRSGKLPVM